MSGQMIATPRQARPVPRMLVPSPALQSLRHAVTDMVRSDGPDLSQRQLAVLMTVGLTPAPHTVRGLAEKLNVSKPAITRAVDRLEELQLVSRKTEPQDRRSVLMTARPDGLRLLAEIDRALREGETHS